MGVYGRKDSKFWWVCLEGVAPGLKRRFPTEFLKEHEGSYESAQQVYWTHMLARGRQHHGLVITKPSILCRTFCDWYDQHVIAHHRGAARERQILQTIRKRFGHLTLAQITKAQALEWRTARAAETSAATANREMAVLKHLLVSAVPKYLETSPIARLKDLRPARREIAILSRTDERKLLKVLPPVDRAIVICALDTLMRLSDVANLRREQDRTKYLIVDDPKVDPYKVPVSRRLRRALNALPKDGPYYFASRRYEDDPVTTRSVIKNMLKRACEKANITYGRKEGGITFHALRHTGATRMAEAGVPLRVIQELGGWKSMRQLERYAHPTDAAKMAAVETVGSRVGHVSQNPIKKRA